MPQNQLILLVAKDLDHYDAVVHQAGFAPQNIRKALSGEEGLRAVETDPFDCLLLDMNLPDMTTDEFLTHWQQTYFQEHSVVILLAHKGDEARAAACTQRGAQDYVVTEDLSSERLRLTVSNAISQLRVARQLAAQSQQIQRLSARVNSEGAAPYDHTRDGLPEQLKQQAEELEALYNASSVLFQSRNVLELSHQISQSIIKEFNYFDCGILLISKSGNKLVRAARAGNLVKRPTTDLYLDGPGLVPEAIRTNALIYAPYVTEHPYYVQNDSATRSELVIPLRGMNGVLGVFDLQSMEEDAFSERDQRILQTFAERAGAALEVVQLYEEQDQHAARLEFRVAQRTADFQHSKDKVETMLNSISDAIILVNSSRIIEQINPAFQTIFGCDGDDVFNVKIESLFDVPVSQVESIIHSTLNGQAAARHELPARRKDGSRFIADTIFSPLVHESFQHKVICTIRDVSLQKQLENELRKALEREKELSDIKSRFTSMVSHEFRTPLAVILSTAAVIDMHLDKLPPEGVRQRLNKISVQVKRLTRLMDDVLTLSRAEAVGMALQTVPLNMTTLCQTIVEELAQSHDRAEQIRFTARGGCDGVLADESLIRHILSNLLSNAIKYSPAGRPITFDLLCSGDRIHFTVIDEGIGIPETSQKHLFESFHRAANVGHVLGTGLGLAIVKKAVDAHGGTIRFESAEGRGTTFEVELPVSRAGADIG